MHLHIYRISANIEILNPKTTNVTVGCIYRHPHIDLNEFNDYFVNNLLGKISKENKILVLLGDFNAELLNYDQHSPTNEFLDSLSSHMLLPHIVQPTRIRNNLKTLLTIFTQMSILQTIFRETLLPQYQTISPNFFLLLTFPLIRHLQS